MEGVVYPCAVASEVGEVPVVGVASVFEHLGISWDLGVAEARWAIAEGCYGFKQVQTIAVPGLIGWVGDAFDHRVVQDQ